MYNLRDIHETLASLEKTGDNAGKAKLLNLLRRNDPKIACKAVGAIVSNEKRKSEELYQKELKGAYARSVALIEQIENALRGYWEKEFRFLMEVGGIEYAKEQIKEKYNNADIPDKYKKIMREVWEKTKRT